MKLKSDLLLAVIFVLVSVVVVDADAVGNTVFVDAINGNDLTGMRGRSDLPFLTLGGAKNTAVSGDTIRVRPGAYNANNLLKNGVNWHFENGASVTSNGSPGAIFDDYTSGANAAIVCTISGNGVFNGGTRPVLFQRNATGSNISLTGKNLTSASPSVTVYGKTGKTYIQAETITGGSAAVWWESGEMYVTADVITSLGAATIYTTRANSTTIPGFLWLDAKYIQNTGTDTAVNNAIWFKDGEATTRVWINASQIEGPTAIKCNATNVVGTPKEYVRCQKVFGLIRNDTHALYLTAQKVAAAVTGDLITLTGGVSWLSVDEIDDGAIAGNKAINVTGGTHYLTVKSVTRSTAGDAVTVSGGAATVTGATITTQPGSNDLVRTGGILSVLACSYSKTSGTITQGDPKVAAAAQFGTGPSNPPDGNTYQFFLNTFDTHLYGWNGSTWKQLDN